MADSSRHAARSAVSDAAGGDWRTRALDQSDSVRRTQERVLEQTDRLIEAAKDLYTQAASSEFTVQQIAEGAGMSLQTFYRYFKSKDDLMLAVHERATQDSVDQLQARFGSLQDPVERLRQYTVQGLRRSTRVHPEGFVWTLNAERLRLNRIFPTAVKEAFRPYEKLVEGCVEDGVTAGVMSPALPAPQAALVVSTLVVGIYRNLSEVDGVPDTRLEDAWTFICAGLGIAVRDRRNKAHNRRSPN